jgi:hypothetical protein
VETQATQSKTCVGYSTTTYCFSASPWHPGWSHWQVISVMLLALAHTVLQCFFPAAAGQLQAGWAHFEVAFIYISLGSVVVAQAS